MNTLILLSLLVAAVSAGNIIYTPGHHFGYHGFGHALTPYSAFHGYYPGAFHGYYGFPGYAAFPYGFHHAVKAEEAPKEEEPAAEEGSRKKRAAEEDDKVVAVHRYPHFAYPYGFAHHAFPYAAFPYAHYPVVKYEEPKVEVKTIKLKAAPYHYGHITSFPFGFPYVAVTKKEEAAAEEGSRKKRSLYFGSPFHGHHAFYSAPLVTYAVKPVEKEHKYKTVSIETDDDAYTPADTTLAGLQEKEHSFKTLHYPFAPHYPYGHHY